MRIAMLGLGFMGGVHLRAWLANYREVARSGQTIIYRRDTGAP
jgi:predicted dehydrogenase